VVGSGQARDYRAVPKETRVWMVRLRRGDTSEIPGTLKLVEESISFVPKDGSYDMRIEVSTISKARRVRGSPVLIVRHQTQSGQAETAFYFTQPPPMPRTDIEPSKVPTNPLRRKTKRKTMRRNASYLTSMNATHKAEISEWLDWIKAKLAAS
jgi:hypothetical protein